MGRDNFIRNLNIHIIDKLRRHNMLTSEMKESFEKFKKQYESNPELERDKLLGLLCKCLLHHSDEKKVFVLLKEYSKNQMMEEWEESLPNLIRTSLNKFLNANSSDIDDKDELKLKIFCNFLESFLMEFETERYQMKKNESVHLKIVQHIINLLKIFMDINQENISIKELERDKKYTMKKRKAVQGRGKTKRIKIGEEVKVEIKTKDIHPYYVKVENLIQHFLDNTLEDKENICMGDILDYIFNFDRDNKG